MTAPLRLAVDDSAAFNQGAGIGRYARNLVPATTKLLADVDVNLWYAPVRPGAAEFDEATLAAFAGQPPPGVRRGPLSRRRMDQLWFRARVPMPFRVVAGRADLVYSPDFTAPPDLRTPRIVTVHDLAFLLRPEFAPGPLRHYLSSVVPRQVKGAARIIAVSETTARDLQERLKVVPSRISVVPNGVDDRFFAAQPLNAVERTSLGVPSDYLLTVGTLEPRKNHLTLLAALDRLSSGSTLPLVVAGRKGWDYEPILKAMDPLRQRGRVVLLDYVSDAVLPSLYAGAAAVIYPSWYEGFGLPVLEAMATGIPVVASDVPALREVGADSVLFASPSSAEGIAGAIEQALSSDHHHDSMTEKRRARARQFRWSSSGSILARVITDLVGRPDLLVGELG